MGVVQLVHCLRVNTALTSLNLWCNPVGDVGATVLAECLRVNNTLKSLNLGFNEIGEEGFTRLAECLRINASLSRTWASIAIHATRFSMRKQHSWRSACASTPRSRDWTWKLAKSASLARCNCWSANATLTSLNLGANEIGDAGAAKLTQCLRAGTTLTELFLHDNGFSDASSRCRLALQAPCPPHCKFCL